MKPLKYFFIIGLQVLVLANIAHTFVLLTANIEDVKKLAKKFVSESIAEQIADFIAKVNVKDDNISQQNEENEKVSAEDYANINNIIRSDTLSEQSPAQKQTDKQPKYDSDQQDDILNSKFLSAPKKYAKVVKRKPALKNVATTESHQDKLKKGKSVIADYEAKLAHIMQAAKESQKIRRKPKNKPISMAYESTVGYAEKYGEFRNFQPHRSRFSLVSADDLDAALNETNTPNFEKLTSPKEKTDFDQYDYTKLLQTRFVTSGRENEFKDKDKVNAPETQTEWF